MRDSTTTEIALGKAKLAKLLLFAFLFIMCGFWMLSYQPTTTNPFFNSAIIRNGVGVLSLIFGGLGAFYFIKKISDGNPGIIINEMGIVDNSSAVSIGHIPWSDITEINERVVQVSFLIKEKFIMIAVRNPDDYISRQTSLLKRKGMKANLNYYGAPISISANGLSCKHAELKSIFENKFAEYKSRDVLD